MKICPLCENQQADGMNYCSNCGNSFANSDIPKLNSPHFQSGSQNNKTTPVSNIKHENNMSKTISVVLNIVLITLLFLQLTLAPLSFSDDEEDYEDKYKTLEKEHQQLETEHQQLATDYGQLENDYAELQSNYTELKVKYEERNKTLENLQFQYENMSSLLEQKNVSYEESRTEYELMASNYSSAVSHLKKSERECENLTLDYENLAEDYSELDENRSEIYGMYNQSLENYTEFEKDYDKLWDTYLNLWLNVTDFFEEMQMRFPVTSEQNNFITPDDPAVQDLLETILGDDADGDLTWSDQEDIYDFINDNKDYSYDPYMYYPYLELNDSISNLNYPEFWSYPNETIEGYYDSGVFAGDCEDFTNLLLSLFFAEENNNYTFGISLDTQPYEDGGGHAACFVRLSDSDIYIYDIAGEYMDGDKGSAEDTLEDYGYNWNSWGEVDIWNAYNPHCSKEFEDNDEFLDWWET